jgi:chromate transporter
MLLQVFLSFLQIGAFSFGGGYAALPLIQNQVVTQHAWMTMTQFTDLISIAEMTPGPIAVNSATFVGIHLAGIPGALVATLGCILPSIVFVSVLGYFYYKYGNLAVIQGVLAGLRPAVVAMIGGAGVTIFMLAMFGELHDKFNPIAIGIFAVTFILLRWKEVNPIYTLLISGVVGGAIYLALGIV